MKKLAFVGKNVNFYRFIELFFKGEIVQFYSMEEAGRAALRQKYEAIIVLADCGELIPTLSVEGVKVYTSLRKAGQKVYVEMYDASDYNSAYLFGFMSYTRERAIFDESLIWQNQILQARAASYIPGRLYYGRMIAEIGNCIGSHIPVIETDKKFPVLVSCGSFLYAATRFSRFDRFTMLPNARWKTLFISVFAPLLDEEPDKVEKAFEVVWPSIKMAGSCNTIHEAITNAVHWHFDSGIMPDESGASGCYELICSNDLKVRMNQRVDSMLLTSALLCTAGITRGNSEWKEAGNRLAEYCMNIGMQFTQGANKGIFCWYNKYGLGQDFCYSSDTGRDGMAILQLYRMTKDERYLESLKMLGEAYLIWTDNEPWLKATSFETEEVNLNNLKHKLPPSSSPVFYEGMAIVLANLYRITGDDRYRQQLKLTAEAMLKIYPNYSNDFTPLTKNFLCSRLITILCAAQEIGCGDYSGMINELLDFFEKLQDDCGGVQDSELIIANLTYTHEEFAVSMGAEHDKIVDMLYCINNLLGCLSIIRSMNNPLEINYSSAMHLRERLIRFVLDIQITEGDARLKGGWMRAYDMESQEYFGVNKDKVWGAYCIMAGWVMGFIPLLLLEEENAPSIYSIEE